MGSTPLSLGATCQVAQLRKHATATWRARPRRRSQTARSKLGGFLAGALAGIAPAPSCRCRSARPRRAVTPLTYGSPSTNYGRRPGQSGWDSSPYAPPTTERSRKPRGFRASDKDATAGSFFPPRVLVYHVSGIPETSQWQAKKPIVDDACVVAQLRNTSSFGYLNAGSYPNAGQMLSQANLIDLFGRLPLSQAVAERFHYATQLWIFSPAS